MGIEVAGCVRMRRQRQQGRVDQSRHHLRTALALVRRQYRQRLAVQEQAGRVGEGCAQQLQAVDVPAVELDDQVLFLPGAALAHGAHDLTQQGDGAVRRPLVMVQAQHGVDDGWLGHDDALRQRSEQLRQQGRAAARDMEDKRIRRRHMIELRQRRERRMADAALVAVLARQGIFKEGIGEGDVRHVAPGQRRLATIDAGADRQREPVAQVHALLPCNLFTLGQLAFLHRKAVMPVHAATPR